MNPRQLLNQFLEAQRSGIPVKGVWDVTITREDGRIEHHREENTVTAVGLNAIASRIVKDGTVTSLFGWLAVGSGTTAPALANTALVHEVSRKPGATLTSSKEVAIMVATWGGAADSVTSVALEEAGIVNHANSGQGTLLNRVTGVATTLADSDFLKLQVEVQVGSHNL